MNKVNNAIQNDHWLEYVERFPIAFAQVREDTLIDKWIAYQLPDAAHGIMIASGGCTSALLAAIGKFERLTLVDMNPSQLALAKLKISLVSDCSTEERLNILGYNTLPMLERKDLLLRKFSRNHLPEDIFGKLDVVSTIGPDFVGRYELLFSRLQYVISDNETTKVLLDLDNLRAQIAFLKDHPAYIERLKQAFKEVMALPNLIRLFGEEATQNSVMPFAEHFFIRTLHAIKTLPAASNPYLSQLLSGAFNKNYYPWLLLPQQSVMTHIEYRQSAMMQTLAESADTFDFIHLSNIFDWLSKEQAKVLLETAAEKLKKGGWLIIRQLNSNLQISELCQTLTWQNNLAATHHEKDRSFFYQQLHIARKL
jgi:S-adenosylmethionine-diacylglycerol 3-amino-3-carboxypropyl transferase